MGRVLVRTQEQAFRLPLSTCTVVGSRETCDGVIRSASVPTYWVEIRWRRDGWFWRTLAGSERTRGPGSVDSQGWRRLPLGRVGGQRIVLGGGVASVELVDDSDPSLLLECLESGERLELDEAMAILRRGADNVLRSPSGQVVENLTVFRSGTQSYRVHLPVEFATETEALDLAHALLDIHIQPLRATFTQGRHEITLTGESVRTLLVLAEVRLAAALDGGWMSAQQCHQAWIASGGKKDSPIERVAWERGKVRRKLRKLGVSGVEDLFEHRHVRGVSQVRIGLPAERMRVWES